MNTENAFPDVPRWTTARQRRGGRTCPQTCAAIIQPRANDTAHPRAPLARTASLMFTPPCRRLADAAADRQTKRTFALTMSEETPLRAVRTLERTLTPRLEATEVFRACIVREECE